MSRNAPGLILAYKAQSYIPPRAIVRYGSDGAAAVADAPTDFLLGVSTDIETQVGENVDVVRSGVTPVMYGGPIGAGEPITVGPGGVAMPTTAGTPIIGYAEVSGAAGDIGSVFILRGKK